MSESYKKISQLASYYLECLAHERDTEVSVFATSKFELSYVQLEKLPDYDDNFREVLSSPRVQKELNKMNRSGATQTFYMGYPVYIRATRNSDTFKIEPLFLFPFTKSDSGVLSLGEGTPRINMCAFKGYSEQGGSLFNELVNLQSELKLDEEVESQPDLHEMIPALLSKRPYWPWIGAFDPKSLETQELGAIREPGIYNSAILVRGEGSNFTKGLELELTALAKQSDPFNFDQSVLSHLARGSTNDSAKQEDLDIIEALQLNYEQKAAIRSAFNHKLTVVTGPPGTGKSQVVTSIIINAARKGWKVLFTSKNNKAVDVVEARVNGLGEQPLLMRLGAKTLQSSLAEKLTDLLTKEPSQELQSTYDRLELQHKELSQELNTLQKKMEDVIDLRNRVDRLDQHIVRLKRALPLKVFENLSDGTFRDAQDSYKRLLVARDRNNYEKVSFLSRCFWWALKAGAQKTVFQETGFLVRKLQELGFSEQETSLSGSPDDLLSFWDSRAENFQICVEYKKLAYQLKNTQSFESLCEEHHSVHETLVEKDEELWHAWLALTANRLTPEKRQLLGQYSSVLKYIVDASDEAGKLDKATWRKYYKLSEQIADLLPAWAITSLSARGRIPLEPGIFDLVIIDEASQCDMASALPLLYRAKRAVIIGDPKQLRHITTLSGKQDLQLMSKHEMTDMNNWGYAMNSCFDVAATLCEKVVTLKEHHRSQKDIIQFSNEHFYGGELRVATKTERLKSPRRNGESSVEWKNIEGSVERFRGSGACNRREAQAVFEYVRDLVVDREYRGTIGVVTPFRGQANIINEMFAKDNDIAKFLQRSELLIDTVHKFQGDERDVIIFSPVVSSGIAHSAIGYLKTQGNLFNVAITRARSHLAVIGDLERCRSCDVSYLTKFASYVENLGQEKVVANLSPDVLEPEYPRSVYNPQSVSDWEVTMYKEMFRRGIRAVPQYREDNYRLDFAIFNGDAKLNVEVDGERYHKDWTGQLRLEDQIRNERLKELGWSVKRFWVYQIRDDLNGVLSEIEGWMSQK